MKKLTFLIAFVLLLSSLCSVQATDDKTKSEFSKNMNASTLYLKIFNDQPFKAMVDNTIVNSKEGLLIADGLMPGKHLLKITQQVLDTNSKTGGTFEKTVYYGYIEINPKREVFAYITQDLKFKIAKENETNTVYEPVIYQNVNENIAC